MISSSISGNIGGLNTFLEIIASAMLGVFILKNFKYSLTESIAKARSGQISQEEFIKTNVGRGIGAVMLIIPGFFTDIMGLLLQVGITATILSKIFTFKPVKSDGNYQSYNYTANTTFNETNFNNTHYTNTKRKNDEEIIDVEVIDSSSTIDNNTTRK
jgi:2-isopropylmalate synthase/UPF0716 protein FxsA